MKRLLALAALILAIGFMTQSAQAQPYSGRDYHPPHRYYHHSHYHRPPPRHYDERR